MTSAPPARLREALAAPAPGLLHPGAKAGIQTGREGDRVGSFRAAIGTGLLALMLLASAVPLPVRAQPAPQPQAPITIDLATSSVTAEGRARKNRPRPLNLTLDLSHAAPWRAYLLDAPPRLVIDFQGRALAAASPAALSGADLVPALRWGAIAEDRGRLVAELPGPMALTSATLTENAVDPGAPEKPPVPARLAIRLAPVAPEDFRPSGTGAALPALWDLPQPADLPTATGRRPGPLRVTLDPGHGGFDPGAVSGTMTEAALMLDIARQIAALLRERGVEVTLTRDDDVFVPLERRMTAARVAGADAFISLHADALPAGEAAGAAVFTWSDESGDRAARELAARHDRDDLLAGLDLAGTDDQIAGVLMDLARTDTGPRSQNLAQFLLSELAIGRIGIRQRPVKGAAFSVLKSPDIASVLIETGFLSDAGDRRNLADPVWRAMLVEAVASAVIAWFADDAERAPLLRR